MNTAIILSGGKSKRMGQDKGFLTFKGKVFIEIILEKLKNYFSYLILAAGESSDYDRYRDYAKVVGDIYPGRGPLGGIYTGLYFSPSEINFILPCDNPFFRMRLLKYLLKSSLNKDICICKFAGKLQPLFGVYKKSLLVELEDFIKNNKLSVRDFVRKQDLKIIPEDIVKKYDREGKSFMNINRLEDYLCLS